MVSRSVYEDEDSCFEAVVSFIIHLSSPVGYSVWCCSVLQSGCYWQCEYGKYWFSGIFWWIVEGYYDFLSNKDIHVGLSTCYKDVCRKFIATATSHYSLYLNYLRVRSIDDLWCRWLIRMWTLLLDVVLLTLTSLLKYVLQVLLAVVSSYQRQRQNSSRWKNHLIIIDLLLIWLERLKFFLEKSFLLTRRSPSVVNSILSMISIVLGKELLMMLRFSISFTYGVPVDRNVGFTPLSGAQS